MTYKIVGVDENSLFPPRVETRLNGKFADRETVNDGRLSSATLDARFNGKADISVQETVEDGRLSESVINSRFEAARRELIRTRLGGIDTDPRFKALQDAIIAPVTTDMRVCVLGSSSSNGAYVTRPEKAVFQRLAYRSGAKEYGSLAGVSGPVGGVGVRWWTGSEGNTTSVNYFPAARRQALSNVGPDIVIHMIGENDYFYGTAIANYINNMEDACSYIESVSPGAINVLVHSHGRNDVVSPVAPWNAYRDALKNVADAKPESRYFIDTMEYFYPLGTMRGDNVGGMLMDNVHPGDAGHKYLAKIIGAHLGIPDPDDYATKQTWDMPLGTVSTTYTTAGAVIGATGLTLTAVNFPREIEIEGSLWVNNNNSAGYLNAVVTNGANGSPIQSVSHSMGAPGAKSVTFSDTMYVPPRIQPGVILQAFPNGSVSIEPDAGAANALSRIRVTASPI